MINDNCSVLVPSYNHAPFVEKTLRSIFAQTLAPKKLLVIDDGSKDNSAEIIAQVLKDCPFESEFIARENRGLCATLNEGLARTGGDFFAYLGSDDLWLPTFLEKQSALLNQRNKAVLAFGHCFWIDENEQIAARTDEWTDYTDGDALSMLLHGEIFSSPSVVYRRKSLEKHGWNENARLEDYELYLKLALEGEFARNDEILCAWRIHGTNTSGNTPLMLEEMLAAQNRLADELKISREELARTQKQVKFDAVANLIRHGHRREAAWLFLQNLKGAKSPAKIAETLFRLSVPQTIFQWNRTRKHRKAIEKFGNINRETREIREKKTDKI